MADVVVLVTVSITDKRIRRQQVVRPSVAPLYYILSFFYVWNHNHTMWCDKHVASPCALASCMPRTESRRMFK